MGGWSKSLVFREGPPMPLTPLTGVAIPQHPTQDLTRFEETANRGGGGHTRREGLDPPVFFLLRSPREARSSGCGLTPHHAKSRLWLKL